MILMPGQTLADLVPDRGGRRIGKGAPIFRDTLPIPERPILGPPPVLPERTNLPPAWAPAHGLRRRLGMAPVDPRMRQAMIRHLIMLKGLRRGGGKW